MFKLIVMSLSSVLSIGLAGLLPEPPQPGDGPPPPPKAKAKEHMKKGAPGDELRKTYDLLRRVRADTGSIRTEERITDWTERATNLYRQAIRTKSQGEPHRARELGTAAHDLARAVDHARNAARLDRQDPDLPPPPDDEGPGDVDDRTNRDLNRAYERITTAGEFGPGADAKFYLDAARDLYNAARRDVEAGRDERGGELARAAEAMTHVPEHLSNAGDAGGPPPRGPEPKKKGEPRDDFGPRPDPKRERPAPREHGLPPRID